VAAGRRGGDRNVDLLFCNDNEALGLAGLPTDADPARAAEDLLSAMAPAPAAGRDAGLPAVVHKQGRAGATVHTRQGRVRVAAPAVEVVDTVGAGDTLAGTVLASLLAGSLETDDRRTDTAGDDRER
jgi:ribokinase